MVIETREGWSVLAGDKWHSKLVIDKGRIDVDHCESTLAFIKPYLKPGTVAIDVGAHIGNFTIFMMRTVGRDGLVVAIEPAPETFLCLARNVAKEFVALRCLNCLPLPCALSNKTGKANFVFKPEHPSASGLLGEADESIGQKSVAVEVLTLDDIGAIIGDQPISFLKIDVEGSEIDVLRGGRKLISEKRPVMFIETSVYAFAERGITGAELEEAVIQLGYRIEYFPQEWIAAGKQPHDMLAIPL
jgi:FkbM family methyltransferase